MVTYNTLASGAVRIADGMKSVELPVDQVIALAVWNMESPRADLGEGWKVRQLTSGRCFICHQMDIGTQEFGMSEGDMVGLIEYIDGLL